MPIYDRHCPTCGWCKLDNFEPANMAHPPCPECAAPTERLWLLAPGIIPDSFKEPLVDRVMDRQPQVFYSRSEHAAAMKARGLTNRDEHIPPPGTDKSKHTTRWI